MERISITPHSDCSLNELLRLHIPARLGFSVSNSKIRRLIVSGSVCVNGRQVRVPAFSVFAGSTVDVVLDEEKFFFEKQPDDIDFGLSEDAVLFEDDSIIVVNKPARFPTEAGIVGARDNLHAAVVRFLFARQQKMNPNLKNPPYVGIMHRLDRDTSGVVLFTKTRSVNAFCHELFENHRVQKVYIAASVMKNRLSDRMVLQMSQKFSVAFPVGRISPKSSAAKWGSVPEKDGGLSARTDFKVLSSFQTDGVSGVFVECRPFTGRTHQIRVHLASSGMPILGDVLYGGPASCRMFLHALSLAFPHPVTGEELCVSAPVPEQFLALGF